MINYFDRLVISIFKWNNLLMSAAWLEVKRDEGEIYIGCQDASP